MEQHQGWIPCPIPQASRVVIVKPCSKCDSRPRREGNSWCQPCINEASKAWRDREGNRYVRYGLTREDLYYMWLFQGGRCDICRDRIEVETCHVDHDNSCCSKEITKARRCCGECVRSLLCGSCNQGLGNFKDNPYSLAEAIRYLERY